MAEVKVSKQSSMEVFEKILRSQPLFILDVRNEDAYADWKIEGPSVSSKNIPYFDLLDSVDVALEQLPKHQPILVVCAKEGSSQYVAEQLTEAGVHHVTYLEGGMKAWSELYYPVQVKATQHLELIQVIRPGKGCLSYILRSGSDAIIVDPARHINRYTERTNKSGAVIRHVLDTHLHADHISGGQHLTKVTGAKYWISDSEMIDAACPYNALTDGLTFNFGTSTLEVFAIPTPGHTPGSTSFLVNGQFLLSGDTVFVDGLGRPDLGGKALEWAKMLYDTVVTKLSQLHDDVIVLPSHYSGNDEITKEGYVGAPLGDLRGSNELVAGGHDETLFTALVSVNVGETPPNYQTIVDINRGVKDITELEASELEIGPNRCAVKHLA